MSDSRGRFREGSVVQLPFIFHSVVLQLQFHTALDAWLPCGVGYMWREEQMETFFNFLNQKRISHPLSILYPPWSEAPPFLSPSPFSSLLVPQGAHYCHCPRLTWGPRELQSHFCPTAVRGCREWLLGEPHTAGESRERFLPDLGA